MSNNIELKFEVTVVIDPVEWEGEWGGSFDGRSAEEDARGHFRYCIEDFLWGTHGGGGGVVGSQVRLIEGAKS